MRVPKKVCDRLRNELIRYQKIAASHRDRGVSEADTVTLVKDMLSDAFGYDKYLELTSEQQIRGTFCDLAIKIDGTARFLIEVKAAGTDLTDNHLRQVVNYGAHHGIEWLVLTNAVEWQMYRLRFSQPIEWDLVASFNINTVDVKNPDDLTKLFLLCREGLDQEAIARYYRKEQQLNRYTLAQVLQSPQVLKFVRREFRRLFRDLKISEETLKQMLCQEILKPDLIEGEKAKEAAKLVAKTGKRISRKKAKAEATDEVPNGSDANEPLLDLGGGDAAVSAAE